MAKHIEKEQQGEAMFKNHVKIFISELYGSIRVFQSATSQDWQSAWQYVYLFFFFVSYEFNWNTSNKNCQRIFRVQQKVLFRKQFGDLLPNGLSISC